MDPERELGSGAAFRQSQGEKEARMSRLTFFRALLLTGLVALVIAPAGALGAKPERFHEQVVDFFEAQDVCGLTVDVAVSGVFTDLAFFDKEGNFVRFMSLSSFRVTFTDADGDSVIVQNSGMFQFEEFVDEEAGTITFMETFKGLPEKIQTARGPLLLRDAGIATFISTFDLETGELISEDVITKGPHPELDSDFELFCEVVTDALA
jgi:hypothetical protein